MQQAIEAEAVLDGLYLLRTAVPEDVLGTESTVCAYGNLARVARTFRCMKTVDLHV